MIGFYDYTVITTYISLICSMFGMLMCVKQSVLSHGMNGDYKMAVLMLALSGLLDMFDGKIARTKKDRTSDEKKFGIQLDSLCDVICFGAYPVLLAFCIGMRGKISYIIFIIYILGAVIRLAFFNVMEEQRQKETGDKRKEYQGLPVTSIAVIFPVLYFMGLMLRNLGLLGAPSLILQVGMLITGVLFVVDFKVKKPSNLAIAILVLIVAVVMIFVFRGSLFKVKPQKAHKGRTAQWAAEEERSVNGFTGEGDRILI
ncbi:MAG: CDP-diacylglycerol--serine O-phosphatidyltransferase [Lachnospiraceae bacterium]|nr:CDP-diacylglycerol--serine O-phosphatidyltransferase [Lachnospiraceae bacterium]